MGAVRRFARSVALASFLGSALVGGAALELGLPTAAQASYAIDESYFYTSLAPYGSWVDHAQFGWVWYPNHRDVSWRPYTVGQWVWTDYGEWMWASDEPFGWATYHYGRWFLDPYYGWVWLPGNVWAPAWVSWRVSDFYIGWAPLSPWGYYDRHRHRYYDWDRWGHDHASHWRHRHHDRDWDWNDWDDDDRRWHDRRDRDDRYGGYRPDRDDRDDWTFTRKRDFAGTRIDRVAVDRRHLADVMRTARDVAPPSDREFREGRGITRGIGKETIERAAGRSIRPVKVVEEKGAPPKGGVASRVSKDRISVYRPAVKQRADAPTPDRLGVASPSRRIDKRAVDTRPDKGNARELRERNDPRNAKDRNDPRNARELNDPRNVRDRNEPRGSVRTVEQPRRPETTRQPSRNLERPSPARPREVQRPSAPSARQNVQRPPAPAPRQVQRPSPAPRQSMQRPPAPAPRQVQRPSPAPRQNIRQAPSSRERAPSGSPTRSYSGGGRSSGGGSTSGARSMPPSGSGRSGGSERGHSR